MQKLDVASLHCVPYLLHFTHCATCVHFRAFLPLCLFVLSASLLCMLGLPSAVFVYVLHSTLCAMCMCTFWGFPQLCCMCRVCCNACIMYMHVCALSTVDVNLLSMFVFGVSLYCGCVLCLASSCIVVNPLLHLDLSRVMVGLNCQDNG